MGLGHASRPGIGGRGGRWFIFLGTLVTRCFISIGPPIWITDDFEALVFGMSIHATFFTFEVLDTLDTCLSLRIRLVDLNPTTAKDAWTYIAGIFQDNKRMRAMALKAELHNLKLADLSTYGYFQKLESIVSVLNGLGSPLSNYDVVTFALEGLPSTYETIFTVIVSREPFPDLKTVRSLLTTHELRLMSRVQNSLVVGTSASPIVLLAKSNTSARRGPFLERVNNPCWSFAKGYGRFGDAYLDIVQSQLAKFGLNAPNTFTPSPPVAYMGVQYRNGWVIPTGGSVSAGVTTTGGLLSTTGGSAASLVFDRGSTAASDIINMCIYSSIIVGDGRFIPVTNFGHSVLSTPFRSLHLNNVLITPNIVKNLIFVRDNSCTVEFDPFDFSVKDFITRWVLLRCDSTGDLYPDMKPSTIPHTFLTSQYTWHQ
nr:ribonuclease H-like domain-containing protein [Tanacetum cinerariifolium]